MSTSQSPESPADILRHARDCGRPIVPFLAAGISVRSGYPTVTRIQEYLALFRYYIKHELFTKRLGFSLTSSHKSSPTPASFLEHFGWPSFHELQTDLWDALNAIGPASSATASACDRRAWIDALYAFQPFEEQYRDATRASRWGLGRWRLRTIIAHTLLQTLQEADPSLWLSAREDVWAMKTLTYDANLWDYQIQTNWWLDLLALTEGQVDFGDLLFASLEQGRKPSSAHTLLVHLFTLLNVSLVVTTNFDSLLETAMRDERFRVNVFDIFRDAPLPHHGLLSQDLTLLKVHGSRYGLRMGERIDYSLDVATKQRALNLIPEDALLLVIGFSGNERRMRELLEAVTSRSIQSDQDLGPALLWMHHEHSPPAALQRLRALVVDRSSTRADELVVARRLHDVTDFVLDVWATIAATYPTTIVPYRVSRTRIKEASDNTASVDATSKTAELLPCTCPPSARSYAFISAFVSKPWCDATQSGELDLPSLLSGPVSSCASVKLSTFVDALETQQYTSIWIDLERHHTVVGVIDDIFAQMRRVDPDLETPVVNLLGSRSAQEGHDIRRVDPQLRRVANRLHHALRRGRYVIAFDGLDVFARPQTVHHGIPEFTRSVDTVQLQHSLSYRMVVFLRFLSILCCVDSKKAAARVIERLGDTYLALSVDIPSARHRMGREGTHSETVQKIATALHAFIRQLCNAEPKRATDHEQRLVSVEKVDPSGSYESAGVPPKLLADHASVDRAIARCVARHCLPTRADAAAVLLQVLSVFRSPRSIVAIRNVVDSLFGTHLCKTMACARPSGKNRTAHSYRQPGEAKGRGSAASHDRKHLLACSTTS